MLFFPFQIIRDYFPIYLFFISFSSCAPVFVEDCIKVSFLSLSLSFCSLFHSSSRLKSKNVLFLLLLLLVVVSGSSLPTDTSPLFFDVLELSIAFSLYPGW